MTEDALTAIVIDDREEDRDRLLRTLRRAGSWKSVLVNPPEALDVKDIADKSPDIVLVDYQLNEGPRKRNQATYLGSTLAAALRERLPFTPIVLLTRRSFIKKVGAARDVLGAYDSLYFKDDVYGKASFGRDLRVLAEGFKALKEQTAGWAPVLNFLGAREAEQDVLRSADPPQALLENGSWRVTEVSRWIRETLLGYPGVLYNPSHASVALGLNVTSFLRDSVQERLADARYDGVFAPGEPRWWTGRLLGSARDVLREAKLELDGPMAFAKAWRVNTGEVLRLSVCNTSNQSPADSVCFVLKTPVKRQYSLPYRPDSRPQVMDEARVSFKAIRETDEYDLDLFAPDARPLAEALQQEETRS